MVSPFKEIKVDEVLVKIYKNRDEMGKAAAFDVAERIREIARVKDTINIVFAAAPSQNEFLSYLNMEKLDWNKINAFHMDEYIGLPADAPQSFASFLKERLFSKKPFKNIFYINGNAVSPEEECNRLSRLLEDNPLDITCMGIGENGHIAFNDPHVADFDDPKKVKIVDLDEKCRQQQVNDGCFKDIDDVPRYAITMTIPTLVSSPFIFCIVPGKQKAEAVRNTLLGPVSESCPASIIRRCKNSILYLDLDSASKLDL
ncbi:MAG TPA: glucosamine-6-phosphate deaminase [bacterium]|nr:glucosamine-6-phosphate deaminase [bacterium]